MATNFDINLNADTEDFAVEFGEVIRIGDGGTSDFNKLKNRPSYAGEVMTGDTDIPEVPTKVSELTNDEGYQTGANVAASIASHNTSESAHPHLQGMISGKQDTLTAGENITIDNNVISADDSTYTAGSGLQLDEDEFSVDTSVIATQQNLSAEITNRENADNALQQQIDGISAASDVVDIVGTYAELEDYDTQDLKDNDIIKVLQDETQNNATTYYRWNIHTQTFTLIGQEGPYYTKSAADAQFVPQTRTVNNKALSANITLSASDVGALDPTSIVQTTGTSQTTVMSQNAVTNALATKLNSADYIVDSQLANTAHPVQNNVLNTLLGQMPPDFFSGLATIYGTGTNFTLNNAFEIKDIQILGDTTQQASPTPDSPQSINVVTGEQTVKVTGKNLFNNAEADMAIKGLNSSGKLYNGTTRVATQGFIPVKPNTTYTVNAKPGEITKVLQIFDCGYSAADEDTFVGIYPADEWYNLPFTFTTGNDCNYIRLGLRYSDNSTMDLTSVVDPQLEESSTATTYQPYQSQSYTVDLRGKNLFDKTKITSSTRFNAAGNEMTDSLYFASDWISVKPNTQYVVSPGSDIQYSSICLYDGSKTFIERILMSDSHNFTTSSTTKFVRISNGNSYLDDTQLELGSTASAYTPYSPIELCKIGDYQDKIYKSGGDWYVHKEVAKQALGSLTWVPSAASTSGEYRMATTDLVSTILKPSSNSDIFDGLCTHYISLSASTTYLKNQGISVGDTGYMQIYDPDYNTSSSATAFTTWLQNNNVTAYYAIATPTDTKITDTTLIGQLEALETATCYGEKTIFTVTASSLPGILQVEAYQESLSAIIEQLESVETYDDFVGTDGTAAGEAGLVPAPAITDIGKFLSASGDWEEVASGGGITELTTADYNYDYGSSGSYNCVALWLLEPGVYSRDSSVVVRWANGSSNILQNNERTVFVTSPVASGSRNYIIMDSVNTSASIAHSNSSGGEGAKESILTRGSITQTTGTATDIIMSQNAVTGMVFADPSTKSRVQIGNNAQAQAANTVSIGTGANSSSSRSVAVGPYSGAAQSYSVALGFGSTANAQGEVGIGLSSSYAGNGYNSSDYRLLTGLYDPQSAHDAATKGYVDSIVVNYATLTAAGAPTTSTAATSVGQLYYDSTNDDYYYCSAIDTTDPQNPSYTWSALSTGGGGPTVVQTTGTSQTDVMSQNATTGMVFADPGSNQKVRIGIYAQANNQGAVAIGRRAYVSGVKGLAFGYDAEATGKESIALGDGSSATTQGQMDISTTRNANQGYNSSNYRLLTGLYDPQNAHDAATKGYVDGKVLSNAGAPTTTTVGSVGQLLEDTTNGKLYQCTAIDTTDPQNPSYTWTEVGAGGSGPTVVQTTGTSTTDVMSQNAVTSMICNDPSNMRHIQIGAGSEASTSYESVGIGYNGKGTGYGAVGIMGAASGNRAVAIGAGSSAAYRGSVAFSGSTASAHGMVSIGVGDTTLGYNNSNYRLISGVYDGQSAHDAVTVDQVNATIDAINTALSTNIPHIGASN